MKNIVLAFLVLLSGFVIASSVATVTTSAAELDPFNDQLCRKARQNGGELPTACKATGDDPLTSSDGQDGIIVKATRLVGIVVGIMAIIMIMLGGFTYITSNGDQQKVSAAKDTILYAVIGLVVALSAQVIVGFFVSKL